MQNGESKRLPERWDIWLAKVYFDGTDEFKYRPVLVIKPEVCYVLSLGITSHLPRDCWGEYVIQYWEESGLTKPSTIRCSKIVELEYDDFEKYLGRLHPSDLYNLQNMLSKGRR